MEFSCDSQITVKKLKRLIRSHVLKTKTLHADLWLRVQAHLDTRRVYPVWINSHLGREAFFDKFGRDLEWAHLSNDSADSSAGSITHWLSQRPDVRTFADINAWTDNRTQRLQKHLIPRVQGILEAYGKQRTKPVGPKPPTEVEFLAHLRTTHPWHSWHHTCRQANCTVCGLRLTTTLSPDRLRELASQPCPMTMMDLVPFGVHYTHSFNFEGVSRGWLCRCKLLLKMHSRDAAWHRAAKGCKAFR